MSKILSLSTLRLLVQLQKLLLRTCLIAFKTTTQGWHTLFTLFIDFLLLRGISMAIKEIYVVHIWTCSKVFACFSFFVFLGRMKQASKQVHVPSWSLSQLTARNAGKLCVTISGFPWMFGLNYQTISLIATSPTYFKGFSTFRDFFVPGDTLK